MVAITTGILGALLYSTASSALGSVADAHHAVPSGARRSRSSASSRVARWGTWQGPVVFAAPDVPFLLGAPLGRRALAVRPLRPRPVRRRRASPRWSPAWRSSASPGRAAASTRARPPGWWPAWPCSGCSAWPAPAACSARRAGRGPSPSRCPPRWRSAPGSSRVASAARPGAGSCCGPGRGAGRAARRRRRHRGVAARARAAGGRDRARRRRRRARLRALPHRAPRRPRRGAQRRRGVGLGARRAHGAPVPAARRRDPHAGRATALRAPRHPELADPVARRDVGAARAAAHAGHAPRWRPARPPSPSPPPTTPRPQTLAALGSYVAASIMLEPLRQEIDQPSASRVLLRRPFGRILLGHVAVPIVVHRRGRRRCRRRRRRGRRAAGPRRRPRRRGHRGRPGHRPLRRPVLAARWPPAGERPGHGHDRRPLGRRHRGRVAAGVAGGRRRPRRPAAGLRRARDVAVERAVFAFAVASAAPFTLARSWRLGGLS